jgi:hypothetical protein
MTEIVENTYVKAVFSFVGINYIYADANNNYKDRIARLISSMQPPGYYCLTLLYSIPVRYSGTLNVYTQMNDGDKTIIFSKDNGKDDAYWWKSVLNIEAFDSYQVSVISENYIYIQMSQCMCPS